MKEDDYCLMPTANMAYQKGSSRNSVESFIEVWSFVFAGYLCGGCRPSGMPKPSASLKSNFSASVDLQTENIFVFN